MFESTTFRLSNYLLGTVFRCARRDEKRREREFVVLGPWNDDAAAQDDVDST